MSNMADVQETAPPKYRSLRIRPTRVDYSEDEGDEERTTAQSKDKSRGSKRKAELNIESLYCQENVKDLCPTSLETIFESPQKGQNRSRMRTSKCVNNVSKMSTEEQVMSVKKWKRFCSFSNYYNPPKQKTKVRKDRAKKLKQLTGVKVPKGIVSDKALQTVLAVLSDDEDQIENFLNGASDKSTLSFYSGNVIKPDIEDTAINDVIRNISAMQVVNEDGDEKVALPQILLKDFDVPLFFSDETDNPRPLPSQGKKSRRRSERFSGSLLPPSSKSTSDEILCSLPLTNEVEEFSKLNSSAVDLPGRLEDEKLEYLDSNNEEQMMGEINLVDVKSAAKRRNVLSDKKVVKKPKRLESTLKRQNDSKDEQCLKKRGNVKDKDRKAHIIGHCKDNILNTSAISMQNSFENISDMPVKLLENQSPGVQRLVDSGSVQLNETTSGSVKRKRRTKRRVSGINRPLYRTILEPPNFAELESVSPSCSPNSLDKHSYVTHWLNTSGNPLPVTNPTSAVNVSSLKDDVPKICQSPTSPCTQMAALSLQTDREAVSSSLSLIDLKQATPKRRTRRKSERLSLMSVVKPVPFNISMSGLDSLPSESSTVCSNKVKSTGVDSCYEKSHVLKGLQDFTEIPNEMCDMSQKVQKKKEGGQLMSMFSQLELRNDSKEEIKYALLTNDVGEVDSLSRDKREFPMNSEDLNSNPVPCQVLPNCKTASKAKSNFAVIANTSSCGGLQDIQTKDMAFSDNKDRSTLHSPKKTCAVERSVPPLTCTVKSENNTSNHCDTLQGLINPNSCIRNSQHDVKNVSKTFLSNINQDCQIFEEDIEWNSPIITGMFKNKVGIRCGKVYRNRESTAESPIIIKYVHDPRYKEDCPPNSNSEAPCGSGKI